MVSRSDFALSSDSVSPTAAGAEFSGLVADFRRTGFMQTAASLGMRPCGFMAYRFIRRVCPEDDRPCGRRSPARHRSCDEVSPWPTV